MHELQPHQDADTRDKESINQELGEAKTDLVHRPPSHSHLTQMPILHAYITILCIDRACVFICKNILFWFVNSFSLVNFPLHCVRLFSVRGMRRSFIRR